MTLGQDILYLCDADVAVAAAVYERAKEMDVGRVLPT